ncbi:MAG: type II toxin-antitoxin system RelB/DinJ family antitoxin [Clostridia bacterium]|jgi:DNA-damage-inducible protein J|nr:type II toxin-antitoxin system RelB/DinJ family antitoxin [Clostridia bacterium]MCI9246176.1 type II toxin-antitoxin system RelB/DinJ family antitoxin [Clostridia bacterium]
MAQTNINIRIDEELKKQFDEFCNNVGMTMTTAFCIFAKKTVREQKIPFEISNDAFYSESNIKYLETVIDDIETGRAKLEEHELIEEE